MTDKFTDAEKIDLIKGLLAELHTSNFSPDAFAVLVEMIVAPAPLTEADLEWARNKAKELGLRVEAK